MGNVARYSFKAITIQFCSWQACVSHVLVIIYKEAGVYLIIRPSNTTTLMDFFIGKLRYARRWKHTCALKTIANGFATSSWFCCLRSSHVYYLNIVYLHYHKHSQKLISYNLVCSSKSLTINTYNCTNWIILST